MSKESANVELDGEQRRVFMRRLLDDLRALERMLNEGMIEEGVRRIGAEQEMFLIDRNWRPANAALELLEKLDDPRFTTELGLFNLELNLDPQIFGGDCLRNMERQLNELLSKLRRIASEDGVEIVLAGILPTLRKSDLGLENMTPKPRYQALNRAMSALRGGAYEFHIKGLDELMVRHDSLMLEACNASFQVHFQVGGDEFPNLYNIAQVVAAPVLAAGVNSPLLFGRQLWRETRIALFQQAVDTRSSIHFLRERYPRVRFGNGWVHKSVLEIFQEDVSRFRTLVATDLEGDPLAALQEGKIPQLSALRLHNGTVYRWNRACYGMTDGKPHLRIENRILPSGPTVLDEVANAAFWFGLISALSSKFEDITQVMEFEDAKMNFNAAARLGLGAQFAWFDGETLPAANLICDHLLPMARDGLEKRGIDARDVDRYLGVIDERVGGYRTGAQWMVNSLTGMRGRGTMGERLNALTAAIVSRQQTDKPVAQWDPAKLEEAGGWQRNFLLVEQYMTTDLFTVSADESLDLVASLMEWERIRHIPVEDANHRLVGLVSYRSLLALMARGQLGDRGKHISVSEIMRKDPITVSPDASTLEAIGLMIHHGVGCLPVVKDDQLAGIITERDLMNVAAELLREQLKE
jgi:CBS domain-containing protein/gamma-glutamylcysteine synthetase